MQIGRKIYYDKATGIVIQDTGERHGSVIETTTEQDFATYAALSARVPETVSVIQLTHGQHAQDFSGCSGYKINPATGAIEFSYPDPTIPNTPPVYQKPLSQEVTELKAENSSLNLQMIDIWEQLLTKGVL